MSFVISNSIRKLIALINNSKNIFRGGMEINYLDNIKINNGSENVKNIIIHKSFGSNHIEFTNNFNEEFITMLKNEFKANATGWHQCISGMFSKKHCFNLTSKYIQKEINSTAYILHVLGESLIFGDEQNKFKFSVVIDEINIPKLTGVWKDDMNLIKMNTFIENGQKGKLIMGFGPSASGKTYWAKKIINMLRKLTANFPSGFLSIDGGIYREQSLIYQSIINNITEHTQLDGFRNLVSSNIAKKMVYGSLFSSDIIKKHVSNFLKLQAFKPNLYIPETLGGCSENLPVLKCSVKTQKYIEITNSHNDWVGLCIWQHMLKSPCSDRIDCCPYTDKYKCKSTTESGVNREKTEGKKYSNKQWTRSYENGISESMKAPQHNWFHIHNSGGYGCPTACATSIIEIHSEKAKELLAKSKYIILEIEKEHNCEFRVRCENCHPSMPNNNPSILMDFNNAVDNWKSAYTKVDTINKINNDLSEYEDVIENEDEIEV